MHPTTNIEEYLVETFESDDLESFLTECPEFCRAAGIPVPSSYSHNLYTVCA